MGEAFPAFLLSVAVISLSGVMMPGPVTTATVALSRNRPWAGLGVGAGHCLLEAPVLAVLFWGAETLFQAPGFQRFFGISGGFVLAWMGWSMYRTRRDRAQAKPPGGSTDPSYVHRPVAAGFLTSLGNPYLFLWWATVGAALATRSEQFGLPGIIGLIAVHWTCDLGWGLILGFSSHGILGKSPSRVQAVVFGACGWILIGFGIHFLVGALL